MGGVTVERVRVVLGWSEELGDGSGGVDGWQALQRAESRMVQGMALGAIAEMLGVKPDRVRVGRTESGAPMVERPAGASVAVSMSHGGGLVGCAVAVGRPVGLDIEREREIEPWERVAEAYLTDRERAHAVRSASPGLAVLRLLSRKEALLKAAGVGMGLPLGSIDVLDDTAASSVGPAGETWSLWTLEGVEGWLVTVAAGLGQMEVEVSWAPRARD